MIHTYLHCGILLSEKVEILDLESFLLGCGYSGSLINGELVSDSFRLGYTFHSWLDTHLIIDLEDLSASDRLILDMERVIPLFYSVFKGDYEGIMREAYENILSLENLPMPLYLVSPSKKEKYTKVLVELIEVFLGECIA